MRLCYLTHILISNSTDTDIIDRHYSINEQQIVDHCIEKYYNKDSDILALIDRVLPYCVKANICPYNSINVLANQDNLTSSYDLAMPVNYLFLKRIIMANSNIADSNLADLNYSFAAIEDILYVNNIYISFNTADNNHIFKLFKSYDYYGSFDQCVTYNIIKKCSRMMR